jgi:hypothetical protein
MAQLLITWTAYFALSSVSSLTLGTSISITNYQLYSSGSAVLPLLMKGPQKQLQYKKSLKVYKKNLDLVKKSA